MKTPHYIFRDLIPFLIVSGLIIYGLILFYQFITSPSNPIHMKPYTFFLILGFAVAGTLVFIGCEVAGKQRTHTEYSVMIDRTDSMKAIPDKRSLITDIRIDKDIWNSVNFSFGYFSDVSLEPHLRLSLAQAPNRLAASEFTRKREVETFKATLPSLLDSVLSDTAGKPNSSIYLPIAEELTRLSKTTADRKVLVIYSDLMENAPDLSFYSPNIFALFRTNPDKVKAMLFAKTKLPNLTGIEIILIYHPKNAQDDAVFRTVSNFFSTMFSQAGATVTISANLSN